MARDVLATHMSQRASLADRYYNLSNQQDTALPVSSLISETMSQKVRPNSLHHFFLPASPKPKAGLGVQSLRPSVTKSCHRNSSETTDPIIMKLGMLIGHHM